MRVWVAFGDDGEPVDHGIVAGDFGQQQQLEPVAATLFKIANGLTKRRGVAR